MSVCRASFMNFFLMYNYNRASRGVTHTSQGVWICWVLQSASLLYRPLNCQLVSIRVRVRGGRFSPSGWDTTSSSTYSTFCRTASHQKSELSLFPLQGAAVPWTALIPIARRVKQLHTVLLYLTLLTAYSITRNTQSFKDIHIFFFRLHLIDLPENVCEAEWMSRSCSFPRSSYGILILAATKNRDFSKCIWGWEY